MQLENVEPEMRTIWLFRGCDYDGCAPQGHTVRLATTVVENLGKTLATGMLYVPCAQSLVESSQKQRVAHDWKATSKGVQK